MKKNLILNLFILYAVSTDGQNVNGDNLSRQSLKNNDEGICLRTHNYKLIERLTNYPFDKAKAILFVSFNYSKPGNYLIEKNDTIEIYIEGTLPIKNKNLSYQDLLENIRLSDENIDSLTRILYNYDYSVNNLSELNRNCYDPHNAIVFLDEKGKMFEYIELCFLCDNHKLSSPNLKTGNFCQGKYEMLKNYFRELGLTKGITD